ncbi:MAG: VPLPA-CTERM sorting domain-containing protein [Pseudomonadota bacterium]
MTKMKLLGAAAGALISTTVAASAASVELDFLDFTASATGTSGTLAGTDIDWEITSNGGLLSTATTTGPNTGTVISGLSDRTFAGETDGLGIIDDEIDFPDEAMTLSFTKGGAAFDVKLSAAYFLDLFIGAGSESANISIGDVPVLPADAVEMASVGGSIGFGDLTGLKLKGSSFTFFAGPGLDDKSGDFALAGVAISSVPLPAGMLLMGTALGGLGLMRRRKKA